MALSVEQVGKFQNENFDKFNHSVDKPYLKSAELYPAQKGFNSDDLVSEKKPAVLNKENRKEQKQEKEKEQEKEGFFSSIWNWIKNLFTWSKKEEVEKPQETNTFPIKNPNKKVQKLLEAGAAIVVGGKVYRRYNEVSIKDIDASMIVFNDKGDGYTGKLGSYKYKNGIRVDFKFLGIF